MHDLKQSCAINVTGWLKWPGKLIINSPSCCYDRLRPKEAPGYEGYSEQANWRAKNSDTIMVR